jgi:anhydro-N-acetylmuramic acid kinase
LPAPKSLSNEAALAQVADFADKDQYSLEDRLRTVVELIVLQVLKAVVQYPAAAPRTMLATGGGACNTFLVTQLQQRLQELNVTISVPDVNTILYKEALVMALIGTLRWREEANVLAEVTGARKDSVGGAFWIGS